MILKSARIRGSIGIREGLGTDEIFVDFRPLARGLLAVSGPNGAGKTTFLENLTPFPFLRSRPGSLTHHFYLRDSARDLVVGMNGDEYRFLLSINGESASGKIERYVFRNDEPVNPDGKEGSYNEIVRKLFGDPDLFFCSLFMPQRRVPFSRLEPAKRKELLLELIGQGLLQAKCDAASQAAKGLRDEILKVEAAVKQLSESADLLSRIDLNIAATRDAIAIHEDSLEKRNGTVKALESDLEHFQATSTAQAVKRSQLERTRTQLATVSGGLQREQAAYEHKVGQLRISIEQDQSVIDLISSDHTPEKLAAIEARIAHADEVKATYLATLEAMQRYGELRLASTNAQNALSTEKGKYEADQRQLNQTLESKRRATRILGTVPCQQMESITAEACNECQFIKDAITARNEIESLEARAATDNRIWAERAVVLQAANDKAQRELDELDFDAERAAELKRQHLRLEAENPAMAKRSYEEAERRVESLRQKVIENRDRLATLDNEGNDKLAELQSQVDALTSEVCEIEKTIDPKVDELLWGTKAALDKVRQEQKDFTEYLAQSKTELARLVEDKQRAEKANEELQAQRITLAALQSDAVDYEHLAQSLSRNGGFQSMLVEAAGDEMTPFANELLENYGVPWTIEIRTSRTSADRKKEVDGFFVIINTPSGPRELGDLSGGQEVWIDEVLYDAIAHMLRRRSGLHLQTAIKDEADGALDGDRAIAYLRAIEASHKASGLHQTIVISHRPEIQQMIPQRLRFVPGKGIEVEIE